MPQDLLPENEKEQEEDHDSRKHEWLGRGKEQKPWNGKAGKGEMKKEEE